STSYRACARSSRRHLPTVSKSALPVIANHRERVKRTGIEPNPLLANRRARIGCWLHFDYIHLRHQFHPRSPVLDAALAAACVVYPVRLVEVGAVRRAGEQGAFADQLEVTPRQQRIA